MISNQEIQDLIECPKYIYKKDPKNKYKEERGQKKSTGQSIFLNCIKGAYYNECKKYIKLFE